MWNEVPNVSHNVLIIFHTWCVPRCDGIADCGFGEDEADSLCTAQSVTKSGCAVDEFQCVRVGIDGSCDHCIGGVEANDKCIPDEWYCDGNNDCADKSDETDEVCEDRKTNQKALDDIKKDMGKVAVINMILNHISMLNAQVISTSKHWVGLKFLSETQVKCMKVTTRTGDTVSKLRMYSCTEG